jgi:hypothetical protein
MAMWVFLLHNQVQNDIYKKTLSHQDKPKFQNNISDFYTAMKFYELFRAQCVKDSYGCVKPLNGSKKRVKIQIVKYSKPRKTSAIIKKYTS